MDNKIQKITEDILSVGNINSFSVIGDPGCEGLGSSMMKVYANALEEASLDSFILVAGDMVPIGTEGHYRDICEFTESISERDVYVLRGNHDTGSYEDFFGKRNYALMANEFSLVVLDNAKRSFEKEGLDLLEKVLKEENTGCVVIAFHIPLPNNFIRNAVSEEEFGRLRAVYLPWKDKIKYFICGHVHSRFEDVVDGIPFICTGGGGAMIEDVSEEIQASDVNYHIVRFYFENRILKYRIQDLKDSAYQRENRDPILKDHLMDTVKNELMAHLHYLTFADRAERRGFFSIGNLFRALAESEYRHARNFYSILEQPSSFSKTIHSFIPGEKFEYEKSYRMLEQYAQESNLPLSAKAYKDAGAAERIHANLLEEAVQMQEFDKSVFHVCKVCGYIASDEDMGDRCPVCGAPARQFKVFDAKDESGN